MAPSNLEGLNIIHPPQEFSDSQDILVYPELSAQLDLWTNLTFDSDEPYGHRHGVHDGVHDGDAKSSNTTEEEEGTRSPLTGEKAIRDGHINVVTPTNVVVNQPNVVINKPHNPSDAATQPLDLNAFLAAFAIERFGGQPSQLSHLPPLANYREGSVSPSEAATSNPLTAAEDKRRRNTAASARFRLKKKEREAALEGKAKELETKVTELERECEGLRRENGWLRGLVVGVTGAAQGSNTSQSLTSGSPPPAAVPRTKRRRVETESI